MKDSSIAKVYASTFIQLAKENNVDIAKEMTSITEVINASNDLENVLFLDVFTNEEKSDVFNSIAEKLSLSKIIRSAVLYLISEKRINLLPMIYKEVIVFDDAEKGFLKGTIEGSEDSIPDEYKAKLIAVLKKELGNVEPVLSYEKNSDITAGYKITVGDYQVDATVDNQLKSFKDAVLGK